MSICSSRRRMTKAEFREQRNSLGLLRHLLFFIQRNAIDSISSYRGNYTTHLMKKHILLLSILCCSAFAFGQNVVSTTPATTPSSCDSEAQADTTGFLSWNWTDEANNLIQTGGIGLTNLCTDIYILNYITSNGLFSDTFDITVSPCYGASLITGLSTTPTIGNQCNGAINLSMVNSPYYTVDIYSDSSSMIPLSLVTNTSNLQTTNMFCAGNYFLTVTDSAGCIDSTSFNIADLCASLQSFPTVQYPSSEMNCDGSILLVTVGGAPPYTFTWSTGSDSVYVPELCPGSYVATVIDMNGCILDIIIELTDSSDALTANVYTSDVSADGVCDGSVTLTISGGIPPYTILHDTGDSTDYVGNMCEGIHSVWITDQTNDTIYLNYLISNPSNSFYNYTYSDSVIVDSLFNDLLINCTIDYNNVDSAFVGSADILASDSVTITWAIYADSTVSYVTETYYFGGGNGVYAFSVAMFCPQRSIGQYLKIYDQVYLSDALGLDENDSQAALIYPNPFTESIQCVFTEAGDFDVQLTDMTGRVVYQNQFSQTSSVTIPGLQTLASGNYMLQIAGSNGQHVYKLMK